MNKLLFGKILLALVFALPVQAMAGVNVDVSISLPPPIMFSAPPALVVLPETYIYVVPDADVEIFFYSGWWWRPWEGRWYRSRNYSSGWRYYQSVPSFYVGIPSGWRSDYRAHRWRGHEWAPQPIPHQQVQRNWRGWEKNKHWEKQNTWGVRDLKPQTRSQQRPRAIQPQQPRPQPQGKPEVREPAKPQQPRLQQREVRQERSQPQDREVKQQRPQSQQRKTQQQSKPRQGKPERGQENKPDRAQHAK